MQGKIDSFQNIMKKGRRALAMALAGTVILSALAGCQGKAKETAGENLQTEPVLVVPADGNPDDVTCKGSYTAEDPDGGAIVAGSGKQQLTNAELNIFYRLAVNGFGKQENGPDFKLPLDTQICSLTQEKMTWQQYFLQQALDSWTVLQALRQKSLEPVERDEKYFAPIPEKHEDCMKDMPILPILYTKDATFKLNTKEEEFLDGIGELIKQVSKSQYYNYLDEMLGEEFGKSVELKDLENVIYLLNYSYFYFISQTYDLKFDEEVLETAQGDDERLVTLRQILLLPQDASLDEQGKVTASEEAWKKAQAQGDEMLKKFVKPNKFRNRKGDEAEFAQLAHDVSADPGSAVNGGIYGDLRADQLIEPIRNWAFDPERKTTDVTVVRSDFGIHFLYFSGSRMEKERTAEYSLIRKHLEQVRQEALETYPVEVQYSEIQLAPMEKQGAITISRDLLYQDIGHERFTEVPVFLQQDYMKAPYAGAYKVGTHGCGITSFAMLTTYMTDTLMTPAMCAEQFSSFGSKTGTDGRIFTLVPPGLGYFLVKRTSRLDEVEAALREDKKVISLQQKGYFTRGGHYLVLTEIDDNNMVTIRDSNIYNYKRLPEHKNDKFPAILTLRNCAGYWIFDNKVITIPGCTRCGEETAATMAQEYICPKCRSAMQRRTDFLELLSLQ